MEQEKKPTPTASKDNNTFPPLKRINIISNFVNSVIRKIKGNRFLKYVGYGVMGLLALIVSYVPYWIISKSLPFNPISSDEKVLNFFLTYTQSVLGTIGLLATLVITIVIANSSQKENKRLRKLDDLRQSAQNFEREIDKILSQKVYMKTYLAVSGTGRQPTMTEQVSEIEFVQIGNHIISHSNLFFTDKECVFRTDAIRKAKTCITFLFGLSVIVWEIRQIEKTTVSITNYYTHKYNDFIVMIQDKGKIFNSIVESEKWYETTFNDVITNLYED